VKVIPQSPNRAQVVDLSGEVVASVNTRGCAPMDAATRAAIAAVVAAARAKYAAEYLSRPEPTDA
jgi:hypothetical protein